MSGIQTTGTVHGEFVMANMRCLECGSRHYEVLPFGRVTVCHSCPGLWWLRDPAVRA